MRGTAMMEFALAWPVALLVVLGSVQVTVWGSEAFAARSAALAGARAGTVSGGTSEIASVVTLHSLSPALVGVGASIWCPGESSPQPPVWICAADLGTAMQVDVGGSVPALVPFSISGRLPVHAEVVLQKESFAR